LPRPQILSNNDLRAILLRVKDGESLRGIAEDYPVSHQAISKRLKQIAEGNDKLPTAHVKVAEPPTHLVRQPIAEDLETLATNLGLPKVATTEIPVGFSVKGDTIRAIYTVLTGRSHRGTIQRCIDDILELLTRAEVTPLGAYER